MRTALATIAKNSNRRLDRSNKMVSGLLRIPGARQPGRASGVPALVDPARIPSTAGEQIMIVTIRRASILAVVALLATVARSSAQEAPNINKRGDDEKKFVAKLVNAIVPAARTSVKSATVEKYEKKEPKPGRTEFHISAGFKGAVTKKDYTATIVIHVDTATKDKWEVTRIEYKDDSKNVAKPNRKNLDELIDKLNGK
jgi:hypothetical protein